MKRLYIQIIRGMCFGAICGLFVSPWWLIFPIALGFEGLNIWVLYQHAKEANDFYGDYGR